jgi:acyl carrier protein
MTKTEQSVHDYILRSFLSNGTAASLRSDEDLLMVLDSLQILRMLIDLEVEYSIKVDNSELTPENLGTVEKLAAFIERKAAAC